MKSQFVILSVALLSTSAGARDTQILTIHSGQDTVQLFTAENASQPIACTFYDEKKDNCGLVPYTSYDRDYSFFAARVKKDRVEFFTDSSQTKTLWAARKADANYWVSLGPYSKVLSDGQGLQIIQGGGTSVPVHSMPKEGSKVLGDCATFESSWTSSVRTGLVSRHEIEGDWIKVHCETLTCFHENSINIYWEFDGADRKKVLELEKTFRNPCVEGWVRWRSPNGRVLFVPYYENS